MRIFCDFDGTISCQDTTDLILDRLADPSWEQVEMEWMAGHIDAATCMKRQIGLLKAPLSAIDRILDTVALRDGFAPFLAWAQEHVVALTIVSDGVDYFINRILAQHGIKGLRVIANRLVPGSDGGWRLEQPFRVPQCSGGSGVCKCALVTAFDDNRPLVFIGDGRSDFCVSSQPDMLFATGTLVNFCRERGLPHTPFTTFAEVQAALTHRYVERIFA